jgi:hypothetical protein
MTSLQTSSVVLSIVVPRWRLFVCSYALLEMSAAEQHVNKKFVLLHKSHLKTLQMLVEAYREVTMKETQVCKWHKCFVSMV